MRSTRVHQMGVPITVQGTFQGTAGVPVLAVVLPVPPDRGIDCVHHPGTFKESYILLPDHPSTRQRSPAGALGDAADHALRAGDRADRRDYIVKKNGIMMVDFAITANAAMAKRR